MIRGRNRRENGGRIEMFTTDAGAKDERNKSEGGELSVLENCQLASPEVVLEEFTVG